MDSREKDVVESLNHALEQTARFLVDNVDSMVRKRKSLQNQTKQRDQRSLARLLDSVLERMENVQLQNADSFVTTMQDVHVIARISRLHSEDSREFKRKENSCRLASSRNSKQFVKFVDNSVHFAKSREFSVRLQNVFKRNV